MTEIFELALEPQGVSRGRAMLGRAQWAGRAFADYDAATVQRIVTAAAQAGAARAAALAGAAVRETGSGVLAHKTIKNLAASTGLLERHRAEDFVSVRVDRASALVSLPRPVGVVVATVSSTNPVATVFGTVLLALMTRNAIVLGAHPDALAVSNEAARTMAQAAVDAGAPQGCIQWAEEPTTALNDALAGDERTDLVLTSGPAGCVPVLVDRTADVIAAAQRIARSAAFDNATLATSEGVLVVESEVSAPLLQRLQGFGAHLLSDDERDRVRALLFPGGRFDARLTGRDATELAAAAGVAVAPGTLLLLAPIDGAVPEEPLAHGCPCPVLAVLQVASAGRGVQACRALLRIGGRGTTAAVHSREPRSIVDFGATVGARQVAVNSGSSLLHSGLDTDLVPTDLLRWSRLALSSEFAQQLADFGAVDPWHAPGRSVPAYPQASNLAGAMTPEPG